MSFVEEYKSFDAVALANLIKRKQLSAEEVLNASIELINKINPKINAVNQTLYNFAKKSLTKNKNSFFYGVPMLLKDIDAALKGYPMTQGSKYLKDLNMSFNSNLTNKFLSSGCIICGKSSTPEFGLMITTEPKAFKSCKNPWDLKRTTGGSSGGSAAAVASRMVPIAHASDGGGSIRIPSASCGTIGLKPTRGRVSFSPTDGDKWGGLGHSGIISRTVRDTAYMYDHIFGKEVGDPYYLPYSKGTLIKSLSSKRKMRIGFFTSSKMPVTISNQTKKAVLYNAKLCEELGHNVEKINLDYDGLLLLRSFVIIIASHVSQMFDELKDLKGRKYKNNEIENSSRMLDYIGRKFSGHDYVSAQKVIQNIARKIMIQMNVYDSVIMPIISQPPVFLGKIIPSFFSEFRNSILMNFKLGWLFQIKSLRDIILNKLAPDSMWFAPDVFLQNVTGQPAISIPSYWTDTGLPLGVQLVGRYGEESTLIQLAAQIEEISPWIKRIPNLEL